MCFPSTTAGKNARSLKRELVDLCSYNVYYTYSKDGGMSFSKPTRLNPAPVVGERVTRRFGSSLFGDYIGMASTVQYAYPVWIDADQVGSRVVMTKIER